MATPEAPAPRSLTGAWSGEFSYPRGTGPLTPFLARLEDRGGHIAGSVIEPNICGSGTLTAVVQGARHGNAVDFTKTYAAGSPVEYETPVDYVGSLSSDGNLIAGVWSLLDLDGTFEMRREPEQGEEAVTRDAAKARA